MKLDERYILVFGGANDHAEIIDMETLNEPEDGQIRLTALNLKDSLRELGFSEKENFRSSLIINNKLNEG